MVCNAGLPEQQSEEQRCRQYTSVVPTKRRIGSRFIQSNISQSNVTPTTQPIRFLATCEAAGFANTPLFLAGCSLGGCIAVHAAHQRPGLFRGAALLAPMLSLEKASRHGLNPYLRPIAGFVSWLVPTAPIAATTRNTLYPHLQARACIPS